MTVPPPPDFKEEVDIVRIDPLFLERQRNRYASRAVAFLVILNGIAALLLLSNFVKSTTADRERSQGGRRYGRLRRWCGGSPCEHVLRIFAPHHDACGAGADPLKANRVVARHACGRRERGLLCGGFENGGRSRGPSTRELR